ncbi:amidinotransferase [Candidatus Thorarchaeota archaeon]|nr:MAG: amidinotransferase [Candidatus Thorarchaeota archaeon]
MKTKRALVRRPGKSFSSCISDHPERDTVDLTRAREQHRKYVSVLRDLGLDIIELAPLDSHADSCFVEDTVVVHGDRCVICNLKLPSRQGEESTVGRVLEDFLDCIWMKPPATLEGGDVIHLDDRLICGISKRTNQLGAAKLEDWLKVPIERVVDPSLFHLKGKATFLGNNTMVISEDYAQNPHFSDFSLVVVSRDESYATNTLTIGDTVLMPEGFVNTKSRITELGFDVIELELTEFEKCQGSLTCLSIMF